MEIRNRGRVAPKKTLVALACLAAVGLSQSASASITFFGTDNFGSLVNSTAAFNAWASTVPVYELDNLDGLSGTSGTTASLTSTLGNNFTTPSSVGDLTSISPTTSYVGGPVSGTALQANVDSNTGEATFTWNLAQSTKAFGFNAYDNDGGDVTVTYVDGSTEVFSVNTTATGSGDGLFWGVSGLTNWVATVTINTDDPGGITSWDNFVTAVPLPAAFWLFGSALAGTMVVGRRRKKEASLSAA